LDAIFLSTKCPQEILIARPLKLEEKGCAIAHAICED